MMPLHFTLVFPGWALIALTVAVAIDCILTAMALVLRAIMLRRGLEK